MARASVGERMIARLRAEGVEIPDGAVLRRTYAGRNQRDEGAWSWYLVIPQPPGARSLDIGSHWPASYLLSCDEITVTRDSNERHLRSFSVDPAGPIGDHANRARRRR